MPDIIHVEDLSLPELAVYTSKNESQLLHYYEPQEGLFIAESPNVVLRALDAGYEPVSMLLCQDQTDRQTDALVKRCGKIPVYVCSLPVLQKLTGFPMTRGVLCAMRRKKLPSAQELYQSAKRIAILENIVNPTNIGAIFRSAAALAIDAVLLTPACCDPLYRRAIRVSMGTVFQIPWTFFDKTTHAWPQKALCALHENGFTTVALALCDRSVSIDDACLSNHKKLAIILGSEGSGLLDETIQACHYTARIPMTHGVDSLNVAAASAVAFWQLRI